ncbi:MAG: alpha/beta fold hydrolase [Acidimicrobiales bacterium]
MHRLPSSDGVEVAVHDLGGDGPPLLLVHPTGFCAQVLSPLAAGLGRAFRCWALDLRGHGVTHSPPGLDYDWSGFADDVLSAVRGLGLGRPMAFGHSSGGAALLLAEARHPGTFAALWCYEPIVWPDSERARSRAERLAEGAARRRERFPSPAEALANFASKPPFSALSQESLAAYVAHGFAADPDGSVALRCRRETEAAIYRKAVEGDRFALLADVDVPVVVACGDTTDAIGPDLAERLAAELPRGRSEVLAGLGHFGPLEDPPRVATAVLRDLVAGGGLGTRPQGV